MADYADTIDGTFDSIAAAGSPVWITRPGTSAPSNPDRPWEGSDDDAPPFETVAVVFPVTAGDEQTYRQQALIPAKGLDFELTADMLFTDANGTVWQITQVATIAPDMVSRILYTCEVQKWSGV